MIWTNPTFEEIKMDAEIGSYQEDREPTPVASRVDGFDGTRGRYAPTFELLVPRLRRCK